MVAGTSEDWVRWLTQTYAPAGLQPRARFIHGSVYLERLGGDRRGFTDLGEQVRIVGEQVIPEVRSTQASGQCSY